MSEQRDAISSVTLATLRRALKDVDYPASRDDLLAAARRHEAGEPMEQALGAVPPTAYHNLEQVLAAIRAAGQSSRMTHRP